VLTPAAAAWPPIAPLMRLACALFLAVTAVRLWRGTTRLSATPTPSVNTRAITLVTLLNPKAVLFATGGFPPTAFTQPDVFYAMAVAFAIPQLPIALAWIGVGASLSGTVGRISPQTIHRMAAILLAFFSASIGASALI